MALLAPNSSSAPSELLRRFVSRASRGQSAETAIRGIVSGFRRSVGLKQLDRRMEPYLRKRRVFNVEYVANLSYDGAVFPLGEAFADGFRIVLKRGCPSTRTRFTLAHELCHTFFYEIVPELKFEKHEADPGEERLCNLGAAELLMPSHALKREAKAVGASLDSLTRLASLFDVSLEAMLLRLRSTAGWRCELSAWRRATGGGFVLHRLVGGRKIEWLWAEAGILSIAWDTGRVLTGHTYLECYDAYRRVKLRPVFYEVKRRGDTLLALLSQYSSRRTHPKLPLFES